MFSYGQILVLQSNFKNFLFVKKLNRISLFWLFIFRLNITQKPLCSVLGHTVC